MSHLTFLYFSIICLSGIGLWSTIIIIYNQTKQKQLFDFLVTFTIFTIYLLAFTFQIYLKVNVIYYTPWLKDVSEYAVFLTFALLLYSIAWQLNQSFLKTRKLRIIIDMLFMGVAGCTFFLQVYSYIHNIRIYFFSGQLLFFGMLIYVTIANIIMLCRMNAAARKRNLPYFIVVCIFLPGIFIDLMDLLQGTIYFFPFLYAAFSICVIIINVRNFFKDLSVLATQSRKGNPDSFFTKNNLSAREAEIIKLVQEGLRNNEIADNLYISTHTVKTHLKNIFKKTNVDSRYKLMQAIHCSISKEDTDGNAIDI